MSPRHHRLRIFCIYIVVIGFAGYLMLDAINEGMHLFIKPSELMTETTVYLGGQVLPGTLNHDQQTHSFQLADAYTSIPVVYHGTLPSMFKEGREAIVLGQRQGTVFTATKVLAKHDEYYRPKD